MNRLTGFLTRLRRTFSRRRFESEIAEEMRHHIEAETARRISLGQDPAMARRRAAAEFGSVDARTEEVRDHRFGRWFEQIARDLVYGVRVLRKSLGFTTVAVLTLAIGIGATITIFSYINVYLLRPLPYPDGDRFTQIQPSNETFGRMSVAYSNFRDWQQMNHSFESIESIRWHRYNLTGGEQPERVVAGQASANFLPMLGVQPAHGRLFIPEDDHGQATPTALISHRLWQRHFNSDTRIVGDSLILDGELFTVIGILPEEFRYPPHNPTPPDLWVPLGLNESQPNFLQRWNRAGTNAVGKLKTGVSLEQARADMQQVAEQLALEYPDTNAGTTVLVDDFKTHQTRHIRPGILTLMAAVGCVLLIVCVNVAGLLLARAARRTHELSIRAALGARRGDLVRQLLSENLILTLLGAATGLLVARLGSDLLFATIGDQSGLLQSPPILLDSRMALFFGGVTLFSALLFGLFPAVQSSVAGVASALQGGTRSATTGRGSTRLRGALVVTQIAMALVLLSGAGLLVRSYQRYLQADPGYNPTGALTMNLSLPNATYADDQKRQTFYRTLLGKIESLPGVAYAGLGSTLLGNSQSSYVVEGAPPTENGQAPYTERNAITKDFLAAMGTRLVSGRNITEQDTADAPAVALIDERFAQRWWPHESPLGKRIQFGGTAKPDGDWLEVVGVVAHVKAYGIDRESREAVYVSAYQSSFGELTLVTRSESDPSLLLAPIRRAIQGIDAGLAPSKVMTLQAMVNEQSFVRRTITMILTTFALTAMALAALGIYGVIAYAVGQRTKEFGIRTAIGATAGNIMALVLRQGLSMVAVGSVIGVLGFLGIHQFLQRLVFGVTALDPVSLVLALIALLLVTLIACYLPARRAAKADPITALRSE